MSEVVGAIYVFGCLIMECFPEDIKAVLLCSVIDGWMCLNV